MSDCMDGTFCYEEKRDSIKSQKGSHDNKLFTDITIVSRIIVAENFLLLKSERKMSVLYAGRVIT